MILSVCSLFVGVLDIRPSDLFTGSVETWEIFLISRLPRLLAILCTGIGMSVAGLIMQQLCMNKFVSPTTGATISSAQFGILLALLFAPGSTLWGRAAFSFVCAVLGTWVFVWFIQRIQFKDVVMVPLVGIMFSNIVMGVTNYLAYKYEMTQALSSWLVGHFSTVIRGRYELVWLTVPLVVLAFVFANHFNIVGMGKDFSQNLGVPYDLVLFMGLTIAAMITASVVVVVGSISYIGLIVPNIVAMFKGDQIRGTLVDTALFGAVFVLVCDMIGRVVIYDLQNHITLCIIGHLLQLIVERNAETSGHIFQCYIPVPQIFRVSIAVVNRFKLSEWHDRSFARNTNHTVSVRLRFHLQLRVQNILQGLCAVIVGSLGKAVHIRLGHFCLSGQDALL